MENATFIDACLNGQASLNELDNYIEYWHTHNTGNSLREFLGLTNSEYEQWAKSSDSIFKDIIQARRKENSNYKLSVLYVEPNKPPRTIKIDNSLEAMQALVGGNIEAVHPFLDDVALVCNEEGIIMKLPLNRAICNEYYNGIICGSFFICYTPPESEEFLSLPSDLEKKYSEMFKYPERFINTASGIKVEKIKPARTAPELF